MCSTCKPSTPLNKKGTSYQPKAKTFSSTQKPSGGSQYRGSMNPFGTPKVVRISFGKRST